MEGADARLAAALFAVDPAGTGGVLLRAAAGPAREAWLARLAALLPPDTPIKRMPLHIDDDRLLGGLDLAASLAAARPVAQRGLLAEADGGVLVASMAERLEPGTVARLAAAIDTGQVQLARDGLAGAYPARFGVVALDEGLDDERSAPALGERLAFHLDLPARLDDDDGPDAAAVARARHRLGGVHCDDEALEALCATAAALGVDSARAALQALRVARAAAALDGAAAVGADHAALAARLVLAPRATRLPAPPPSEAEAEAEPLPPSNDEADAEAQAPQDGPLEDRVLAAAQAAIPAGLLAALAAGDLRRAAPSAGRAGAWRRAATRGQPLGARRGDPRGGARLDLLSTLRAAAPWQRLRGGEAGRVRIAREDFRIRRYRQRSETTTIFAVDASGSAALHRLAEAKGAVELLLADCYVRRDRVAVLAFRGTGTELLLPPTRSLPRAKRSLAGLPGGGGTPLAAAIDAAAALAAAERRRGATPAVVLLTDGRANIARDGRPGRPAAFADALTAARLLRAARTPALLIDTSPQPQPQAGELAQALGAAYLPLPHAGAGELSLAVRAALPPAG
jgi:magnesium chelatase subunit D